MEHPVAIVGAGPAGLTAAHACAKAGLPAVVFEAAPTVGGLARTEVYKGYRFDIGGHRFFTKNAAVESLWREILGDEFLRRPRLSRIYYRGRFFWYPLRPGNAIAGLGPWRTARVLASYVRARLMPPRDADSLEGWVSSRFGRELYRAFFKTYTEKVWGVPASEIRAEWAAQRIKELDLVGAVRDALFGKRNGRAITSLIEEFDYPRLGPGQMWERLAAGVEARGIPVRLGTRARRVLHAGGRARELEVEEAGVRRRIPVAAVISSAPLGELIRGLDPAPPAFVLDAAAGLRHRDLLTVNLILRRRDLFPDNWIYVHAPDVRVGRIQNFRNWSPEMVPDPETSSLGLEYFCFRTEPLWSTPDADLLRLAARELETLGLARREDVADGFVVRQPRSYPIYDGSYAEHVAVLKGFLAGFENLVTVGRNGLHRYNNQDHSMLTGMLAVRNLLGEGHDLWDVNAEAEYLEEVRPQNSNQSPAVSSVSPSSSSLPRNSTVSVIS
jgi:protoporphyrinogen oxidase